MALEITTVGAKVLYCLETSAATRPTTGFTELPDVNEAPAQDMTPETIDCSNIGDKVTRYVEGRQDPGGDMQFTLNHTDAAITAWEGLVTSATAALAQGKRCWFEYKFPNATKSYFWCGVPKALGTGGIQQNALDTIPAHVVLTGWEGWATAST